MVILLNTYLLDTPLELQKAMFIPGPWWLWLIGAVLGLLGAIGKSDKTEGKSLAILGMQGAGKTQLYNMLKGEYGVKTIPTGNEPYESFDIKLKERIVTISDGIDIGGNESMINSYYKDMIEKKDIVIFVFNIKSYLNEPRERRLINARMEYLYEYALKYGKDIDKNVVIVGSFADKLSDKEAGNVKTELFKFVEKKDYGKLFKVNSFIIDITNKKMVTDLAEKIF